MKTVFKTDEIAHIWAKQSQSEGRVSGGNIYFQGTKIYSYGSHFCMANIVKPGIVFVTDRSYSVTTSSHLSTVRYAVNHMETISVPYSEETTLNKDNAKAWINRIKENLDTISNTRKRPQTKEQAKGNLLNIVSSIDRYLEITEQKLTTKWSYDEDIRKSLIAHYEATKDEKAGAYLSVKLAKIAQSKERAIKKQRAEQLKIQQDHLSKWLKGGNVSTYYFSNIEDVKLRVNEVPEGKIIETSKGARVSLKAGKLLFEAIKAGKDVKGFDLDGYTVISLNGVLTVGCHKIERTEIDRFAKSLNW